MPSDGNYQQTKRLRTKGASLKSPFRELADWIGADWINGQGWRRIRQS